MLRGRDFEGIQRDTGFNLDMLEKLYHLTRILQAICDNEVLHSNLTLKGGTALNLIYLDIPRISIDLDFNFTGSVERGTMKAMRPKVEAAIETIGGNLEYGVTPRPPSYIMSRHYFRYVNIREVKDHVKVEVNYLDRLPVGQIVGRTFPTFFPDLQQFPVRTYTLEELAAQKIGAYIERGEPRDLYDLYRLSTQRADPEDIREYTVIYYCMAEEAKDPKDLVESAKTFDEVKLSLEIQQFIRNTENLDPDKVRDCASRFLQEVLSFTRRQQEFIDTFYQQHEIVPELAWGNRPDIARHPSLLHRLRTLQVHDGEGVHRMSVEDVVRSIREDREGR